MCDLIDLNSPNIKRILDPKLASPLIPVPRDIETTQTSTLVTEKKDSPNSNPFDRVLNETTEYISKKDDPFEVMLQRALKFKSRKNSPSVDFIDDFTPRRRKKYIKIMNKTVDESVIENKTILLDNKKEFDNQGKLKEDINLVSNSTDIVYCDSNIRESHKLVPEHNCKIVVTDVNSVDSSILNQSIMNDTLLEDMHKNKGDKEILIFHKKDASLKELVSLESTIFKPHVGLSRALSQEDKKSSQEQSLYSNKRSQSTTDTVRIVSQNDSNASSLFNKGFLESKQNEQSVFSSLSDVSPIGRLSSTSVANFSSLSSNNTINRAFLNNDASSLKMSNEEINTSKRSAEIRSVQYDLSDLTERLNKLKCTIDGTNILNTKEEVVKPNKEEDEKKDTKLIDVDVFMPEPNFNRNHNKSSISTSSSDSVFIDDSKFNKSIWNEAKALARTFEEFKVDSDSGSIDDLLSNNTFWMSELLPAFEDDIVDNLIELPSSPKVDIKDAKENDSKQSHANTDNSDDNFIKDTKPESTDCASTIKQTTVTTLLLDLKKLVKTENPEASNLIDNLENILGVKYKNNAELLASLNISNELRTPDTSNNKSNNIEQSSNADTDESQNENKKISSPDKICNNENSLLHASQKLENTSQATTVSSDVLSSKTSSCDRNSGTHFDITDSSQMTSSNNCSKEQNSSSDEKLALELLVNLGKLLSDQAEDVTTSHLLKSIGKALNITSNKIEESQSQTNDKSHNTSRVTSVKTLESECSTHPSALTKSVHERSFNSKSKLLEQKSRRSIPAISSNSNTSNAQVYRRKSSSELKDIKNRFSSDSEIMQTLTNKKIVTPEMACSKKEKAATVELESKKEKTLGIVDVKNMLKKKSSVVTKKGPMKAMHPVGAMQKRVSIGKQTAVSHHTTTPPKSDAASSGNKIISSTPNSIDNCMSKKVIKSKPMASSTPDGQTNKTSGMQLTTANKKRNISCDISPVTTHGNINAEQKSSPVRSNKLPTSKKCTPKRQQIDAYLSNIPKYCTPPRKLNSSLDMSHPHRPLMESPQNLNKSITGIYRYSPIRQKMSAERMLQSPLKESNKITPKVKPLKLISKLKGHAVDFTEKENYLEK